MCEIFKLHLKIGGERGNLYREEIEELCLKSDEQYLATGWVKAYHKKFQHFDGSDEADFIPLKNFEEYYERVQKSPKFGTPQKSVFKIFAGLKENDLIWTRTTDGTYWICRVKGPIKGALEAGLSRAEIMKYWIGGMIPVEAYAVGLEVPGAIKAAFSHPSCTINHIRAEMMLDYAKYIFNKLSGRKVYDLSHLRAKQQDVISNLPDFELEELVISYLQMKYNYYVLSNSIARNSTTPKIECELYSRERAGERAVVQVKGPKARVLDFADYLEYIERGYKVFLYAPKYKGEQSAEIITISEAELLDFYQKNREKLPNSVTQWEDLFA